MRLIFLLSIFFLAGRSNAEFTAWKDPGGSWVWLVATSEDRGIANMLSDSTYSGYDPRKFGQKLVKCTNAGYYAVIVIYGNGWPHYGHGGACGHASRDDAYKAALRSCLSKSECGGGWDTANVDIWSGYDSMRYDRPAKATNSFYYWQAQGEHVVSYRGTSFDKDGFRSKFR